MSNRNSKTIHDSAKFLRSVSIIVVELYRNPQISHPIGLCGQQIGHVEHRAEYMLHFANMRDEEILPFRRDGKELFYRIANPRCASLLNTLHTLYCCGE